jgi:transcriptional regulator with XRE-family HTH domain
MSVIGENIKRLRKTRKLSQEDLANMIIDEKGQSISRVTITRYENGRDPNFDMLRKIAEALEVSVVELIGDNSAEAEEKIMIELLIEKTLSGEMQWVTAERIQSMEDDEAYKYASSSLKRMISYYSKRDYVVSPIMSETFYSMYDDFEYLLIDCAMSYETENGVIISTRNKALLVDPGDNNTLLVFDNNLSESLDRLSQNIVLSNTSTHKKDVNKIIDSLSKPKKG